MRADAIDRDYLVAAVATAVMRDETLPHGGAPAETVRAIYNDHLGTEWARVSVVEQLQRLVDDGRLVIDWGVDGRPTRGYNIPETDSTPTHPEPLPADD